MQFSPLHPAIHTHSSGATHTPLSVQALQIAAQKTNLEVNYITIKCINVTYESIECHLLYIHYNIWSQCGTQHVSSICLHICMQSYRSVCSPAGLLAQCTLETQYYTIDIIMEDLLPLESAPKITPQIVVVLLLERHRMSERGREGGTEIYFLSLTPWPFETIPVE